MDQDVDVQEQLFHNTVREWIISILLFAVLYVSSYIVICYFRRKSDQDEMYTDDEDGMVYRITLWLCTFTLASSVAAVLLLPISIISNEILIHYPKSYYIQWLNQSLIHGLWNHVFLFSNVALFIMMPFAYFFMESEGFTGSKKGIMGRVKETFIVLLLLAILVCGIAWVASALIDQDNSSRQQLFDVWNFYLPYLYSCISLLGSLLLLVCTPIGFTTIFTVFGQLVIKPKFLRDINEDLLAVKMEEDSLQRKLKRTSQGINKVNEVGDLHAQLKDIQKERLKLEKQKKASTFQRNVLYPILLLLLLTLTSVSVLMVAFNTLLLVFGEKELPLGATEAVIGIRSFSTLGPFGGAIEIVIILYFMLASVTGFYSIPIFSRLKPQKDDTSVTTIIGNCVIILGLSSALPVLSRTLGITYFDLLGDFGRIDWLGNFKIILGYNLIFATSTAVCLFTKFTKTMRDEIVNRLGMALSREKRSWSASNGWSAANTPEKDD